MNKKLHLLFCLAWLCSFGKSAADTYFIDAGSTFSSNGDWWMQEFYSGSSTSTYVLRFTSDYKADAGIMPLNQASNFQNRRTFSGYGIFDDKIGTAYVTLAPGNYYVGARSQVSSANRYRIELDTRISVSPDTYYYYSYVDRSMYGTDYVSKNGGKLWHGFSISNGYRYFLDGCNTGVTTYIIPSSSLGAFKSGGTFYEYPSYGGTSDNLPGHDELNLVSGSYYLAFHNTNSISKAVTYTLERWKQIPRPTGLNLQLTGPASWRASKGKLTISTARISNENTSGYSGTLRLRLWATKTPYSGYRISGYVLGYKKYSPLNAGYYYYDIKSTVTYNKPPRGTYYTTLTLEEYTTSGYVIRDYINFDGTVRL